MTDSNRRKIIKYAGAAGLVALEETETLLKPGVVLAADLNRTLFENKNLKAVLSSVSNGVDKIIPCRDIEIKAPDRPERWTVVPVQVTSNIVGTTRITLICKELDFPLIADFKLFDSAQGFISTRLRLAEENDRPCKKVTVLAIVQADGHVYSASKDVLLIVSHCDGGG